MRVEVLLFEGFDELGPFEVASGDALSCGGVAAGLDLAQWIVERELGGQLAAGMAGGMDHEPRGETFLGAGAAGIR